LAKPAISTTGQVRQLVEHLASDLGRRIDIAQNSRHDALVRTISAKCAREGRTMSPTTDVADAGECAAELRNIGKRYDGLSVLSDISLRLERGKLHALVGQNGAGKSTCLGILAGRVVPTRGQVVVGGRTWQARMTPLAARSAGVAAIYQELSTVPGMTAAENALLSRLRTRRAVVSRRALHRSFAELAARLGCSIDPDARAGDLSVADRQMLEIMRAISLDCSLLLMDEPTAALAPTERRSLFATVGGLLASGVTVVLVSHYLDEVEAHADTVTVFRDGHLIGTGPVSDWSRRQIVAGMLGDELQALSFAAANRQAPREVSASAVTVSPVATSKPLLRVSGLSSEDGIRDIAMEIRAGEIVGLGGLVGSGRSSLLRALGGAGRNASGQMWLNGRAVAVPRSVRRARSLGICLVPEDRKAQGLVLGMPAWENALLDDMRCASACGYVSRRRGLSAAGRATAQFGLPSRMLRQPAGALSGGNQQKVLLARAARSSSRLLLADEPTRGIDIGAKSVILETLRRLANQGVGIIVASADLDEVAAISDRVYVLREGRIVGELIAADELTEDKILRRAFGLEGSGHD
jgi:ribose transport system ATP-binding protein